jgi:hypothetical protein
VLPFTQGHACVLSHARALPYEPRHTLLSRGEAAFYRALRTAVQGRYLIAFKVRLADLVTCKEEAWDAGFGHMIARQHLDFVLCDWRSTDILLVIELDDRTHSAPRRRARDAFLNEALFAAGVPLLRFRAEARYDAASIADKITSFASKSIAARRQSSTR